MHSADEIGARSRTARQPNAALLVLPDPATVVNRARIVGLWLNTASPRFAFRYFVDSGGLMSYGTVQTDQYRQAASYVDRILRAQSASFRAATGFELVVSPRRESPRLTIPESFLLRADEVIE